MLGCRLGPLYGRPARVASVALVPLALGACSDHGRVDKPTPPDMSAIVEGYDAPTAVLDAETAVEAAEQIRNLAELLDRYGIQQFILGPILGGIANYEGGTSDERSSDDAPSFEAGAAALRGEGSRVLPKGLTRAEETDDAYVIATRICDGWGPRPEPDVANGTIDFTFSITDDRIDPVAWGSFDDCQYRLDDSEVLIGARDGAPGSFSLYVGESTRFRDVLNTPIIAAIDTWAGIDGTGDRLQVDVRFDLATTHIESRVPVTGGFLVAEADTTLVGARGLNGDFECDIEARYCSGAGRRVDF
jgi:hypothetical protein